MAAIVKIEGAAELARDFRAAGGRVRDLSAAHRAIARELLPDARSAAPRGPTGRLAGAHRAKGTRSSASISAGGARVPYAGVVHWGNPSAKTYPARPGKSRGGTLGVIEPNPWLYRTLKRNEDRIVELYDDNVGDLLRAAGLL